MMQKIIRVVCGLLFALVVGHNGQAQVVTVDSIRLAHTGGLFMPATQKVVVFEVDSHVDHTLFRQFTYSEALVPQGRQELVLPGRCALLTTASSRHHLLYQFQRHGSDSLLTMTVDTLGRVVHLRRDYTPHLRWQEMRGTAAPLANGFLMGEPQGKDSWLVSFLDPQLNQRWQHRFQSPTGRIVVSEAVLDSTHAWVLVTNNAWSRLAATTAYCFELNTGQVLCRMLLDDKGERRLPATMVLGPDHSLLVAGYSFTNPRPSRTRTGNLFCTRLHPDGSRSHDQVVGGANGFRPNGRAVLWQGLQVEADGGVRLAGETYSSTSFGGYFALTMATSIVTLGMLRSSFSTLHPRDVITLRLSPTGQAEEIHILPLPEAGSYTMPGYIPKRSLALAARQAGVFRLRGFAPDGHRTLLRTNRRILTMDLHSGKPVTVRETPDPGYRLWYATPQYMLLYHARRSPQRVELERVVY